MIRNRHIIAAVVAAILSGAAAAAAQTSLPAIKPTADDLYVSCYLLVRGTDVPKGKDGKLERFSALQCGMAAMGAIVNREGGKPGQEMRFCLPNTADVDANPTFAMAYAYIDFYNLNRAKMATADGNVAFTYSLIQKWPCRP